MDFLDYRGERLRLAAMHQCKQAALNEVDLIDEFDEPYTFQVPKQNVTQSQKDLSYMKSLEVSVKSVANVHGRPFQTPQSSCRNPRDLSYMELLKAPAQQHSIHNSTKKYYNDSIAHVATYPVSNHSGNYNNNVYIDRSPSYVAAHHPIICSESDRNRSYNSTKELRHNQKVDFEVEILKILYMNSWRSITNYILFPEPNISQFCVTVGEHVFNALRYDYGISFIPFLSSNIYNNFRESPSVNETNRCFFLHLAVGCRVHPFLLQSVFRSRSRSLLNDGRNGSNDYLALELLLQSVFNVADFVDANVLFHLWPEEFNTCRVCFISDTDRSTIFTCFRNSTVSPVRDVIIHCDGSHFTLLAFDISLDQVLAVAIANNNTVNFNEIPGSRYSMQREIENIIR